VVLPFVIYALHDRRTAKPGSKTRHLRHHEVNKWVPPQMRGEHAIVPQPEDVLVQDDAHEAADTKRPSSA
jgi:hypothetical protein